MAGKKCLARSKAEMPDRATAYAETVNNGDIVAGPHVRNACRRHIDDLKRDDLFYDKDTAARAIKFFETKLRLSEGQFEDKPFKLQPAQDFIVGSLMGWKKLDGTRRFRRAYVEQSKGQGKSPLAGGIGLYGLIADGEAGAEIYSAGATKEQAGVLFRDAVKMVDKSPDLNQRLTKSGGPGREFNISYPSKTSFFRPVSRETRRTGSGPRPHFALVDELHEHSDGGIIETLERGFKFRRQPLLLMITNAGSDRNSICWAEHEHAVRVAAGNRDAKDDDAFYLGENIDDTTFSFVCGLDGERTLDNFEAIKYLQTSCTCHSVPITQIEKLTAEVFANHAILSGGGSKAERDALSILSDHLSNQEFVTSAPQSNQSRELQRGGLRGGNIRRDGTLKTSSISTSIKESGKQLVPDTQPKKPRSGHYENTEWGVSNSTILLLRRMGDALSATKQKDYVSTTVTIPEDFGGLSVSNATLQSVFSEIIRLVYSEHSITCCSRKAKISFGKLSVPADDPLNDPSCWPKANPLLGVTITEEYLAGVVKQARDIPAKLNGILRLHFCRWTDADTAWMTRAALEPCLADFNPMQHHGKPVWVGCDLSQNKDITALGFVVKTSEIDGKPTYDAWVEAWTPGDTLEARELRDKQPYRQWVDQGFLNAPKGQSISYRHVAQAIAEAAHEFDIQCLAYDRYAFKRGLEPECDELGLNIEFVEHPQGGTKKGRATDAMKNAAESAGREPEGLWMPMSVRQTEELILEQPHTVPP
jgi:phage terminase large subunit-like protein